MKKIIILLLLNVFLYGVENDIGIHQRIIKYNDKYDNSLYQEIFNIDIDEIENIDLKEPDPKVEMEELTKMYNENNKEREKMNELADMNLDSIGMDKVSERIYKTGLNSDLYKKIFKEFKSYQNQRNKVLYYSLKKSYEATIDSLEDNSKEHSIYLILKDKKEEVRNLINYRLYIKENILIKDNNIKNNYNDSSYLLLEYNQVKNYLKITIKNEYYYENEYIYISNIQKNNEINLNYIFKGFKERLGIDLNYLSKKK